MQPTTVLLADDHAVVRAGIRNALKDLSNLEIVAEVDDGPTLFAALDQTQPELLLIDVTMPHFEPIEAIRSIRAHYPSMRILVVSAYDDDVYVQGLLGMGVDGYHLKDQPLSDLQLAIQRVLDGKRWVSGRLLDKLVSYKSEMSSPTHLTKRQRDILRLLHQGMDNHSIAKQLGLSVKTVENHLTRLYRQIGVQSRLEAANYARQHPESFDTSGRATFDTTLAADDQALQDHISLLLVDDSVRYRHQLRRAISKICPRSTIFEAENITEALDSVQRLLPALVLVDVVLGDEDGIRCTRRIKAVAPHSRVILISAYPDRAFHELGLEAGAIAFLDKKELDAATLRQIIVDTIDCRP